MLSYTPQDPNSNFVATITDIVNVNINKILFNLIFSANSFRISAIVEAHNTDDILKVESISLHMHLNHLSHCSRNAGSRVNG